MELTEQKVFNPLVLSTYSKYHQLATPIPWGYNLIGKSLPADW